MATEVIAWRIKDQIVPGKLEGQASIAWHGILSIVFPGGENFSFGLGAEFGKEFKHLFTAVTVFEPMREESKFTVVAWRAPGQEASTLVWTEAVEHLKRYYLGLLADPTSDQGPLRRFAAVANGNAVRFYEWIDGGLVDFNIAHDKGKSYYLDRECQDITAILKEIKATFRPWPMDG